MYAFVMAETQKQVTVSQSPTSTLPRVENTAQLVISSHGSKGADYTGTTQSLKGSASAHLPPRVFR
jgi:hypothetical protein